MLIARFKVIMHFKYLYGDLAFTNYQKDRGIRESVHFDVWLTESISVSTRAKLLIMTIPVSLEASVTKPFGFKPMQGVKLLMYSSWFKISLPPSKLLTQRGSSVCASLTNSSMAVKASSRNIDLSIDLSRPVMPALDLAAGTSGKPLEIPTPKSGPKGNVVATVLKPPKPLLPTPSSKLEFGSGGPIELANDEMGRPKNLPARAQTRSNSSFNLAFSILRCCSSSEISPIIAGPPQFEQIGFLIASLIDMFSALSLSFSCLSKEFS